MSNAQQVRYIEVPADGFRTITAGGEHQELRIPELTSIGFVALFGDNTEQHLTLADMLPPGDRAHADLALIVLNTLVHRQQQEGRPLRRAEFIIANDGHNSKAASEAVGFWRHRLEFGDGNNRPPIPVTDKRSSKGKIGIRAGFTEANGHFNHYRSIIETDSLAELIPGYLR